MPLLLIKKLGQGFLWDLCKGTLEVQDMMKCAFNGVAMVSGTSAPFTRFAREGRVPCVFLHSQERTCTGSPGF